MPALATRFGRRRVELRSDKPLSDTEIRCVAPSIFADAPHDSCSTRYAHIATSQVLDGLRREGFQPFAVAQCRTRDESRHDYTKHMIRLRHESQIALADKSEAREIIVLNSHDRSSSYQLLAGCFRFACANGLIVGEQHADIRIQHKGDVAGAVIEGAYTVLDQFEEVGESIGEMKAITLSEGEQLAYGQAAIALRYEEGRAPLSVDRILEPRRRNDVGNDLWSVFNRVQENVIRGGQCGYDPERKRRVRTREIKGIDQNVKLNRALWVLTTEMSKLARH